MKKYRKNPDVLFQIRISKEENKKWKAVVKKSKMTRREFFNKLIEYDNQT